jgi:hypothetical protein
MAIVQFDPATLQAICDVIGDTSSGLTGGQIGQLLERVGIADSDISTKRHRLYDALSRRQVRDGSGNNVGAFVEQVMAPVRWVGSQDAWSTMRGELCSVLEFVGLAIDERGRLVSAEGRTSFVDPASKPISETEPDPAVLRDQAVRLELVELLADFIRLSQLSDRQEAGRRLETLLNRLFQVFALEPRLSINVVGEQIDGSFVLGGETYLLEAKWTREPLSEDVLLIFRGKIEGKSIFTRGLFVSISGYTQASQSAITRGKAPNFAMIDGSHLYRVLNGDWDLPSLLRRLIRLLSEEGTPYVPMADLAS